MSNDSRPAVYNPRMNIRDTVSFFLQAATVGIVAAFLLLLIKPEWFESRQPVVEVRQAPPAPGAAPTTPASGPVSYADAIEPPPAVAGAVPSESQLLSSACAERWASHRSGACEARNRVPNAAPCA